MLFHVLVSISTGVFTSAFCPRGAYGTSSHHRMQEPMLCRVRMNNEKDLFEYFDPLLSPHAYPNGISPNDSPKKQSDKEIRQRNGPAAFGFRLDDKGAAPKIVIKKAREQPASDVFDPLLSPHAYPSGTPDKVIGDDEFIARAEGELGAAPADTDTPEKTQQRKKQAYTNGSDPLTTESNRRDKSSPFGFRLEDSFVPKQTEQATTMQTPDVFDPLLSPHAYPFGTPDKIIDDEEFIALAEGPASVATAPVATATAPVATAPVATATAPVASRVGILFIDHGSRNGASNRRLHEIAAVYQRQFYKNQPNVIVRAAHMEIAQPSIPEALQSMMDDTNGQLDEIICHPFFLSPLGRHVSEDIPEIIEGFKKDSQIDIPIVTTDPVGAEISIMMQAVHSLVQQSTSKLR